MRGKLLQARMNHIGTCLVILMMFNDIDAASHTDSSMFEILIQRFLPDSIYLLHTFLCLRYHSTLVLHTTLYLFFNLPRE